jgi:hypothetical protein
MTCIRPAYLTIVMLAVGCAERAAAPPAAIPVAPRSSDGSLVCQQLADRFVGLPDFAKGNEESASRPTPLVGRWWLRTCSATRDEGGLHVRLQGPGWYFVDTDDGTFKLHQQVPFNLSIELGGHTDLTASNGIFSLRFKPDREPKIDLRVAAELDVRPSSAWGTVLQLMPLVPVRSVAADRFSESATDALRLKLRGGATVTYDVRAGQADATVGRLGMGQTPKNAFQDNVPWLVNDRLRLGGAAVQVVGPITPGPTRLDVIVERGAGVAYRALCAQDMDADYSALAAGDASAVAGDSRLASGTVAGPGQHTTDFRVDECKFYLVISALERADTLVSLRVRA